MGGGADYGIKGEEKERNDGSAALMGLVNFTAFLSLSLSLPPIPLKRLTGWWETAKVSETADNPTHSRTNPNHHEASGAVVVAVADGESGESDDGDAGSRKEERRIETDE